MTTLEKLVLWLDILATVAMALLVIQVWSSFT